MTPLLRRGGVAPKVTGWSTPRAEAEQLTDALAGAIGLGSRNRRTGEDAERARLNVTRAIRATISKIREGEPELARHLSSYVTTGRLCRYEPLGDDLIDWRF